MTSTWATVDDFSQSMSEVTPLTMRDDNGFSKVSLAGSGSTAGALLNMDLGPHGRQLAQSSSQLTYSVDSRLPYFVHVREELQYLMIAFDVLMVAALFGVLRDCLPLIYHYDPGLILVPSSFVAFLATAGLIGFFAWGICRHCSAHHKNPYRDDRNIEIVRV
jgi:hypothetical protein